MAAIHSAGVSAVGLSGKDGQLITASKLSDASAQSYSQIEQVDLGFVGRLETVDPAVLHALLGVGMIPVVAPVGLGLDGQTYNIMPMSRRGRGVRRRLHGC